MTPYYVLHFDGSCGPKNPGGTAAYGFTLHKAAEEIARKHAVIGSGPEFSNNVAEYVAVFEGLSAYNVHRPQNALSYLTVYGDSQIVIMQLSGKWKAHGGLYLDMYHASRTLLANMRKTGARVSFEHIRRDNNTVCDALSKAHLTI